MSLLDLSNELITTIAELIHPATIVDFALTCHRIQDCSSGSLALHRSRQRELRAHHDRHPTNIVNLLRTASTSPDLLWYIRVLEFYGARPLWQHWKTYFDYRSMRNEPKVNFTSLGPDLLSGLDLETFFQGEGLKEITHDSIERIKKGDDQPLKTILIASCPSLEKLTWVAYAPNHSERTFGLQPYELLCDLISACKPLPISAWPAGLVSLRSISLGACTPHVHPHDNLHPNLSDFCRLLLLPNLKSLRLNVAGFGDADLEYLNTHVPARSSAVEEITINICDFNHATLVAILERCRSLKSYLDIYLGRWTNILADIQPMFGDTLEELRPEGSNEWELRLYGNVSALAGFPKLRLFTIYIGDLVVKGLTEKYLPAIGKGKKMVEWHDFHAVVPRKAEVIIFHWPPRNTQNHLQTHKLHKTLFPEFLGHLDTFVQQRGKNNGGHLKKICLGFVQKEWLVRQISETEAEEFLSLAENWATIWDKAGVEVAFHGLREGVDEEELECQPTALEWETDEEDADSN